MERHQPHHPLTAAAFHFPLWEATQRSGEVDAPITLLLLPLLAVRLPEPQPSQHCSLPEPQQALIA